MTKYSSVNTSLVTKCAICGTLDNSTEVYPANFNGEELDARAFSARRFYSDKIHFRMVKCDSCGLIRSDPVVDSDIYKRLYTLSNFTYYEQVQNLTKTYGHYLKKYDYFVKNKKSLLEIGCGNGFFLLEARHQGYKEVYGVEPSEDAINNAPERIKSMIKKGMFGAEMFPQESFDVICIFQTLDHFLNPSQVLSDAFGLLRPGGVIIAINHNVDSLSARILKEHSLIIDIEHTYLYNKGTIKKQFEQTGFKISKIFYPNNCHSIGYLFSLLPIRPLWLKKAIHKVLDVLRVSNFPLFIPIGNLGIIATKVK